MHEWKSRVTIGQCGPDGRMTLPAVVDALQSCTQFWFDSEPGLAEFLRGENAMIILSTRQVDVLRHPRHGEEICIQTRVYESNGFYGYRNTALYTAAGELLVASWCVGAFVRLSTGRPLRLPPQQVQGICIDDKLEMDYLPKKIRPPKEGFAPVEPVRAGPFDIDIYGHVNNAKYLRMACEVLPEWTGYNRLRVEYKKPVLEGETLAREVCREEGRAFVRMSDAAGRVACVVELSRL